MKQIIKLSTPSFEITNWTFVLINEAANKKIKRKDIAKTYEMALKSNQGSVNWFKINRAIIDRWSRSGLEYIKREAWKIHEGENNGTHHGHAIT